MLKRSHLRQFLAVVETGSFTAAARRLGLTQPSLSAGIAELERSIGVPLLLRERRALRLTDAGNRLLAHARTIEREFRLAETEVAPAAAPAPPLRLGVLLSVPAPLLARFAQAYGGARPMAMIEGTDADLRRRLAEGQLDAALTLLRPDESAQMVLDEGYAMMLPLCHRLATRPVLHAADLAGETMIARRSCEILTETSRFFTAAGVRPRFFLRSHNDERCMAMVSAGMGITTAPLSHAGPGVVAVPLEGYAFRRRVGAVGRDECIVRDLSDAWGHAIEACAPLRES